jgi:hypothetical protein
MTKASKFDLTAEAAGLVLDVSLNGIPVGPDRAAAGPWHAALNRYLVEGVNMLTVTIGPMPGASLAEGNAGNQGSSAPSERASDSGEESAGSANVELREDGELVFVFVYPPPLDPPEPLPLTTEEEFEITTPIGPRAWEQATPVEEAAGPPSSLIEFLQQAEETLQSRDIEGAVALFEVKTRELAKVNGLDVEAQLGNQRAYMESLFRDPFWGMTPVNPDGVQIRCAAGGRIVFVRARYGRHPLKSVPDAEGITSYFPIAVSFVHEKWVIVL